MTRVFLGFAACFALLLVAVRVIYGGGNTYQDVNTSALLDSQQLAIAFSYNQPIGDLAVAGNSDLFFTVHPAAKPLGNKLLRVVDGVALPFPDGKSQQQLLNAPRGLFADNAGRLWVIDHGNHATGDARLFAFDIDSGEAVYQHTFTRDIAPLGSLLQDLVVSRDGESVFIADTSVLRRSAALIVHNTASTTSRRVLEQDSAIDSQGLLIGNSFRDMTFFGGLFTLTPGLSELALDADEQWLYLAATSNDGLYRVPFATVTDPQTSAAELAIAVERYSDKPLSDGLWVSDTGDIYITDIEHHAVLHTDSARRLRTVMQTTRLRWPDALAAGADGALYVADSALPLYLFDAANGVDAHAPYHIFRFELQDPPATER